MTTPNDSAYTQDQTTSIPQAVHDRYNAHFDNTTYRAFGDALAAHLDGAYNGDYGAIASLLIDSSLERCGARRYEGACVQLGIALVKYQAPELFVLAERHLSNFDAGAEETVLSAGLLDMLKTLQTLAETAARTASAYHGWRGRVVCWWLDALASLAQAAQAILREGYTSYTAEKLATTVRDLHYGLDEGVAAGIGMDERLARWLSQFPGR
jgi:hypothetical protein